MKIRIVSNTDSTMKIKLHVTAKREATVPAGGDLITETGFWEVSEIVFEICDEEADEQ